MQNFLTGLENVVNAINNYLADYILIILLIGVGLFFTIRTKFVQVRCFKQGIKKVFGNLSLNGGAQKKGMSSFQAFTTAVAAQVGTGNIVGACSAILFGGPGAIFWMWIIAFFGMATVYSEAVLAQKTKEVDKEGNVQGGPVYYIRKAFTGKFGKFLAGFFAVAIIIALGFIGSMVQSNSISTAVSGAVAIDGWIIGIIVAILSAIIFIGGRKRIASVTEKLVPIMALIYLLAGLIVLCCRITVLPEAFFMIFKFAFTPSAIIGGGIGYALKTAISMGAKRGLFSNEAGMGSTPHAHAQANVKTPHEQGTAAMIGVFLDTFVVLTMTALIVLTCLYAGNGEIYAISQQALAEGKDVVTELSNAGYSGNTMVNMAISSLFSSENVGNIVGSVFVAVCLFFFAFSTIISWNLFGKINFIYLFGKKSTYIYSILSVAFIFLGSMLSNSFVWSLSDLFNYLMVIPNVVALIALSNLVVNEVKTNGKKLNYKEPNQALNENIKSQEK